MPHIVLEYSSDSIDDDQLNNALESCFDTCIEFDCIRPKALKLRAHAILNAYYGNQADSFVHVTAHLLKGRSTERKSAISKAILDSVMKSLPQIDTFSVDVLEIDGDVYHKNK
ncbi:hypothetical protein [Lentilitoribacter sp. Alg239-R112]|jgi:5-carboxymethyl-2-hydroxymuconate isomerase|uniref:5-carboxymethyl-2-hydroxymuconate Delta-isomerase n=1 Tax=Lentilitoribacter sp. Alg239-R112 TaxID=2305987 RepID=UPI0013A6BA4F|nr:hypothetical protein [Lentilitoribacter sp. Alg239-R112]